MNIGSKVKFKECAVGDGLAFSAGEVVAVTVRNVVVVESALRGGIAVLIPTKADEIKKIVIEDVKNENADILPDVRPRTRGGKRGSKPASGV